MEFEKSKEKEMSNAGTDGTMDGVKGTVKPLLVSDSSRSEMQGMQKTAEGTTKPRQTKVNTEFQQLGKISSNRYLEIPTRPIKPESTRD